MDINEAKDLLQRVLDCRNIKVIYYIDDFTNSLEQVFRFFDDSSVDVLKSFSPQFPNEAIVAKQAEQPVTGLLAGWWDTLNHDERELVIRQIAKGRKVSFEDSAVQILGDRCIKCSPEEWFSSFKNDFLSHIDSGDIVLLLFDKLLNSSHPLIKGHDGVYLAEMTVEDLSKKLVYCGVFSQDFEPQNEFEQRKKYKNGVYPISKKRLSNFDYYSFVEGIINILWHGNVEYLKERAVDLINNASKSLIERYSDIQPADYKQIIINSSYAEGSRESDTMLRLIHIIFDTEIRKTLSEFSPEQFSMFQQQISEIRAINDICPTKMQRFYNLDLVKSFNQDEAFISGAVLNSLLTPLQNGDIFCVDNDKYFVLLCQPCNISLRSFGGRGSEEDVYDIGFWVPLMESLVQNNKLEKEIGYINQYVDDLDKVEEAENRIRKLFEKHPKQPLPCLIDGKQLAIDLSHFKTVSLSILDYTTLNEKGELIISPILSEKHHPIQVKMVERLTKEYADLKELEKNLESLGIDGRIDVHKPPFNLLSWITRFLGVPPKVHENSIVYPVRRIGHLRGNYSDDLLVQLSHYISRTGLPNKFT